MLIKQFAKSLTVHLQPEMYDALRAESDAKRLSIGSLVRHLIAQTLEEKNGGLFAMAARPTQNLESHAHSKEGGENHDNQ